MKIENFLEYMKIHEKVEVGTDTFAMFHELSQRALKITMELNNKYHTPDEIIGIFSEKTKQKVDSTFRIFPPFYTDCDDKELMKSRLALMVAIKTTLKNALDILAVSAPEKM